LGAHSPHEIKRGADERAKNAVKGDLQMPSKDHNAGDAARGEQRTAVARGGAADE